jgi:hypothetical protein
VPRRVPVLSRGGHPRGRRDCQWQRRDFLESQCRWARGLSGSGHVRGRIPDTRRIVVGLWGSAEKSGGESHRHTHHQQAPA